MMRTLAIAGGSLAFGVVVFAAGLHGFFPSDLAIERIRWEIQNASDGHWALSADHASPWRLSGMSLSDVTVYKVEQPKKKRHRRRRKKNKEETPTDEAEAHSKAVPFIHADSVSARLGLLPLLSGEHVVHYDLDVFGGDLRGSLSDSSTRRGLVLEGRDLDMSRIPLSGENYDIEATGTLELDADLLFNLDEIKKSQGEASMQIDDLVLTSLSVYGFDVGAASFTDATIEVNVAKGAIDIKKGHFESDMFSADLSGGLTLSSKVMDRWRMRIEIETELADDLDMMLKMVPKVKDARDKDGVYHFLCTGTMAHPYCHENSTAAGNRPASARPLASGRRIPGASRDAGDDEANADADERRQKRLDRIKERRERGSKRHTITPRGDRIDPGGFDDEFDDDLGPRDIRDDRFDDEFYDQDLPYDDHLVPDEDRLPLPDDRLDEEPPPREFGDPPERPFDPDADFR